MKNEIYLCRKCGLLFESLDDQGGAATCCNKKMEKLTPNTVDASIEKHIPVISSDGEGIIIKVGSEPHPMLAEHYIMWIEARTADRVERKYLKPNDPPEAKFSLPLERTTALIYCNIHGLWKSEH